MPASHPPTTFRSLPASHIATPESRSNGPLEVSMSNRANLALGLVVLTGLPVLAVSTEFSNFTPLTSSAAPLPVDGPEEATPITLPDPKWSQRTLADRRT